MKAFVAFVVSYVGGTGILYGLWTRLLTFDDLLWVFTPFMVLALAYGAARATTGHPIGGRWLPRCARSGRFLSTDSGKWGLTKPRKLSYPPARLEHAIIRSNQPSPYSN